MNRCTETLCRMAAVRTLAQVDPAETLPAASQRSIKKQTADVSLGLLADSERRGHTAQSAERSLCSHLALVLSGLMALSCCQGELLQNASIATSTSGDSTATQTDSGSPASAGNSTPAAPPTGTAPFFMGLLPDYDNKSTNGVAGFVSRTSVTPPRTSGYVNVGPNGAIETSYGVAYIDEARKSGVGIISLSLTAKQTGGSLTDAQLAGLRTIIARAQSVGIELHLRYGYEMNYGGGDQQGANINDNNNPSAFKIQWAQLAAIANPLRATVPAVKMIWSPNIESGGTLPYANWLPADTKTIDAVAVDWYHQSGDSMSVASIESILKSIYAIATTLQVPFFLGETGVVTKQTDAAAAAEKINWLKALSVAQLRTDMPLYQGFYYFDYIKGGTYFSISQDSLAVPGFIAWYKATFAP